MPVLWIIFLAFILFKNHIRRLIIYICLAVLFLSSFQLIPELLKIPLSAGATNLLIDDKASAVIVLTGGIYFDGYKNWYPSPESLRRTAKGKYLSKEFDLPLILMGGRVESDTPSEAGVIKKVLLLENTIIEDRSKNTAEAAENLKHILNVYAIPSDLPLILCTSKVHFFRAAWSFRSLGYKIISPIAKEKFKLSTSYFIPSYKGIVSLNAVIKEYVAIVWYIFKGNISIFKLVNN